MPAQPTRHVKIYRGGSVRIGPISVITLVVVLCLAVMSALAASTAHATKVISGRYAESVELMYVVESAGQEFVAGVDEALASGGGAAAVNAELDAICARVRAVDSRVSCTAEAFDSSVSAKLSCEDARTLEVELELQPDATYRIVEWKMSPPQQEAPATGNLWTGG